MELFKLAFISVLVQGSIILATASSCRCLPGDSCWPTTKEWKALNTTVGGRLVATVPLGSPCHDPKYNGTECAILQSQWLQPQLHMNSSSSVMAPFFANQSCDPFTAETKPCTLGNYVDYAVNVTSAADIIAAVNFAQAQNIRFVIRNTGHDYLGKSTGAGALSVWTHYLKDIEFLNWSDSNYKGKAIKMGAGVQGYEAMEAAQTQGLVAIGGECPTVGVAGGYSQGGGHSALSTSFGLGADQALEWEVVTASGKLITASRTQNEEIYWALSGGGGGTYGVVVSLTAKAHPDAVVSGASLLFTSSTITQDKFYAGIEKFHSLLPAMVDAGAMVVYYFSDAFFEISPITAYGKTEAQVKTILSPFLAALDTLNIPFTHSYTQNATYVDHYNTYFGPLPFGNIQVGIAQYGGRLIPRSTVFKQNSDLTAAVRNITEHGVQFIGVAVNVSSHAITSGVSNAVLPAWRNALIHATLTTPWNFTAPWSEMIALQDQMTYEFDPQLEAVTPGSGAYMNEADFRQPNFKEDFFGANYNQLLSIKNKWDPNHLFYAVTAVGSDAWTVAADGRMCRC
ncbi:FAD-linked oxidoreductase ZEB1 [Hyphodiscus hymeniophilus]|uniref:FAD-linked oxidoreductase ZEB1 n=1 Tax=Hyphodiscus hymeniophilus TaxID=353542 RepID=A0A9P6VIK6_9HELO|nr:FAD-linked oxidoreductase ZEB1 [Hyphodiscus hymeniophilus]